MLEESMKALKILEILNSNIDNAIISNDEFVEQKENIEDFKTVMEKLNTSLEFLMSNSELTPEKIIEELHVMHLAFSDSIWHIDQVHSLIKKLLGNYRDLSINKKT